MIGIERFTLNPEELREAILLYVGDQIGDSLDREGAVVVFSKSGEGDAAVYEASVTVERY